jgi:hypothetical protein
MDVSVVLANRSPSDPRILTWAARDMKDQEPHFALEAGSAALRWLIAGCGYDITGLDVLEPCRFALDDDGQGWPGVADARDGTGATRLQIRVVPSCRVFR